MNEAFEIAEITIDKKRYMSLLLIGDESEAMIDRYLDHGRLFVGFLGNTPIAVVVVTAIDADTVEVKNLAVDEKHRNKGIGHAMLRHVETIYPAKDIILGTGETPSTLRFYESCGFTPYDHIPDFFTDNYPRPIIEEGITLKDMLLLRKKNSPTPSAIS